MRTSIRPKARDTAIEEIINVGNRFRAQWNRTGHLGSLASTKGFRDPIRLCKPFGVLREFIVIKMLHDQHGERARLN
ncbi:MAG: hypothetical protein DMG57_13280 [Acidobacteria bacterium]|nr:MAG: hypothetical protein DMG57_13280 [Acidobacteriota bacterium]